MAWVRFPFMVKYRDRFYQANEPVPVEDDELSQVESHGAVIVRTVLEPSPASEPDSAPETKPASRRGRPRKNV